MSIEKINSVSFKGITKVVTIAVPTGKKNLESLSLSVQKGFCKALKSDTFVPSKKAKAHPLMKITQFFNKDKLVGTHIDYAGGGYKGSREFADGTKISYQASKIGTGKDGKPFFVAGTHIKSPDIIGAHVSHDAYDKKGKPVVLTLKTIKELQNPKNAVDITGIDF